MVAGDLLLVARLKGQLEILAALRAKERLTITQLAAITGANRNTLKVRLRELVGARRVRQHGKARATWYSL